MTEQFESILSISLLCAIAVAGYYFFGTGMFFFQESNSLFIFSTDYFQKFADKPGGLLVYAGNFLTQFYYNSLFGSLIISILTLLIFLVLQRIVRVLKPGRSYSLLFALLPACLLLLMQTRYDFHSYLLPGFLIVLAWFLFSVTTGNKYMLHVLLVSLPVLYYITGAFVIVYLGLSIVYSLIYRKGNLRYILPVSALAAAFAVFMVFKDLLFFQPGHRLLVYPLFLNDTSKLTIYLSLFSGLIILYPLLIKSSQALAENEKSGRNIPLLTLVTFLPLTVFVLIKNFDPATDSVMKFEKLVFSQQWDEVIRRHE